MCAETYSAREGLTSIAHVLKYSSQQILLDVLDIH